ncbi:family 16 glycosylhydrolase [Flavivirga amylovorans]|uniref:Family 16 glycosylhydrolase n=1 Tax=Flavivirga amylovorans TaxID=870486 RepID=A0ABT8X1W1_9FLAO|nr:family 16 glycosylhydrolase [Flavivirga amylovorans]MDO5987594.1 family 16 glycosylhydrolase [Flavivirga amylovorans]
MRYLFLLTVLTASIACNSNSNKNEINFADNVVIAHRGAWKQKNLPQNSIASLKQAIALNCTGSEFDIRMTSDNVLVVTHDRDYHGLVVEASTYNELSKYKLSNGEALPTLKQYLLAGMQNNSTTGFVCEIKPSKIEGRNSMIANNVLSLIKELKAEPYILSYISFSYDILKKIKVLDSEAKTQYLDGSKKPDCLKNDGISGLDYLVYKYKKHPEWIEGAKENGVLLNAWVANKTEDLDWLLANDFDYITTDEPELLFERIKKSPTYDGYKLVWSDEFNYQGRPDSTKWAFEYGLKRNQEKQYYVDSLKNARVEKGLLVLETHKETIKNEAFVSKDAKGWKKNWEYANYTAPSLTTKGIAEWTYGRIEIRAQLPKGVGLWPAFWMIGANYDEVRWPECGEIDIMEHVGFNPDSIFGTIHTKAYNHMKGTEKGKKIFIDKPYDSFHVFALEWTPEKMDFILDDTVYNHIENEHKTTHEWPFDQDFHLKINIAVGGMLGGQKGIDDTVFPQQMLIDYVRVFQKKE